MLGRKVAEPAMLQIGYIVFPGFGVMTFGAMSVFEAANAALGRTGATPT